MSSKLNPIALGMTTGCFSGTILFCLMVLINTLFSGLPIAFTIGTFHISFNASLLNAFVNGAIALLGGCVIGYLFAKIYNFIAEFV